MMIRMFSLIIVSATIFGFMVPTYALTFSDDFNDGNADGWWLAYNPRGIYGNWRVENGTLAQDSGGDHHFALVENMLISDQSIETRVITTGYGGVALWYQDSSNFITVSIYPNSAGINVVEVVDGGWSESNYVWTQDYKWYDLRVEANSATGELGIYLDDTYILTYSTSTPYRTGLSGVTSGNAGGYFDDFRVASKNTTPVPNPSTMLLLGSGILGL
jgi:hypothetical protein